MFDRTFAHASPASTPRATRLRARFVPAFFVVGLGLGALTTTLTERVAAAGATGGSIAATFLGADTNRAPGTSDWSPNAWKATCAPNEAVTGVSAAGDNSHLHAALCSVRAGLTAGASVGVASPAAERRAKRVADWDPGLNKAECALNEYVSGLSQSPVLGESTFKGIRCTAAPAGTSFASSCETRGDTADDRGNPAIGDWDSGLHKNECAAGKVVVGASITAAGKLHHILCCGS